MALYNLKTDGDQYRITKFTNDLDVESSYLLTETECECPAGSRPTCRHRLMLPRMLANQACDKGVFYDYDNDVFYASSVADAPEEAEVETEPHSTTDSATDFDSADEGSSPSVAANEAALDKAMGADADDWAKLQNIPHPTIGHIKRRI